MNTPSVLARHANQALREGRIDDGIVAYRTLLAVEPTIATHWFNLGYLLRCARLFEEAAAAYATALELGINRPEEVHLNRAVILADFLDRGDEAEATLRRAIAIAPRFIAARLNLGNLLEDRGDAAAAYATYADVLAIEPMNGRALARTAAIDVFEGRAVQVPARLRTALATPRLPADAIAEIGFALGSALDAEGAYGEAFAAYEAANRAAAAAAHPALRYDRVAHERLIDRLIALPPSAATMPSRPLSAHDAGRAPVFVCGMFRSGSTLVEQILSRHSRVVAGGELETVPALTAALQPYPEILADASPALIDSLRAHYLSEARALFPDADVLTDQRPDNVLHIGLIKRLFPDARIVHTTRAPLDTILSIFFLYFDDSISYGHRLGDIAHWLGQYRRLMAHWQAVYPGDIHEVAYDAVVRTPEPTIAALLAFCGLDWEDDVLTHGKGRGLVRTASVWQVRQPLHQRSSGRWRNYAEQLAAFRTELGEFGRDL